jgi:hypothetical protein
MALLKIFKRAGNDFHFDGVYRPLAVAKSREFKKNRKVDNPDMEPKCLEF